MAQHAQYGKLVNKQFNSPIGLYSDNNIREVLDRETQMLSNGAVGINFHNPMANKPANLQHSAVLRFLEEEEHRKRGGQSPSLKRVAWPPPPEAEGHLSEVSLQDLGGPQISSPGLQNNRAPSANYQQPGSNYQQGPQLSNQHKPIHQPSSQSPSYQSNSFSPVSNASQSRFSPVPGRQWAPVHSPVSTSPQPKFPSAPQSYQSSQTPLQQYQPSHPAEQYKPQLHQPLQLSQPSSPQPTLSEPFRSPVNQPPSAQYQPLPQQYPSPTPQESFQPATNHYQTPQSQAHLRSQILDPSVHQPLAPVPNYQSPILRVQALIDAQQSSKPSSQYQQPVHQFQPPVQSQTSHQYSAPSSAQHQPSQVSRQYSGSSSGQNQQPISQQFSTSTQSQISPQSQVFSETYRSVEQSQTSPNELTTHSVYKTSSSEVQVTQQQQQQQQFQSASQQSRQGQQYSSHTPGAPATQAYNQKSTPLEPPPSVITLRPEAPVSQAPAPVYTSQPATATLKGGKNLRGDLKWPPPETKERMEAENRARIELAKGPAFRPRKAHKDYREFFAQHALNDTYPRYHVPPGTQFYLHDEA